MTVWSPESPMMLSSSLTEGFADDAQDSKSLSTSSFLESYLIYKRSNYSPKHRHLQHFK